MSSLMSLFLLIVSSTLQGKTGPKTRLSDVVTVREPKEELPDVPAAEVLSSFGAAAPVAGSYRM